MILKFNVFTRSRRSYSIQEIPILITSALKPSAKYTALQDFELRLDATIKALNSFIAIGVKHIVICDGSGVNLGPFLMKRVPENDATIEILYFTNDVDKVWLQGKGYGEGEIIDFALENSLLLKRFDYFAKCTGKLWVANYRRIVKNFNGVFVSNYIGRFSPSSLDTRFYIVEKNFYLSYLRDAFKETDDDNGNYLECVFFQRITKSGFKHWISTPYIRIFGLSGSSGNVTMPSRMNCILRTVRNYVQKWVF